MDAEIYDSILNVVIFTGLLFIFLTALNANGGGFDGK